MKIISNTTVLSNFAEIHALAMVQSLFRELFVATEVVQEIRSGLDDGYIFYSEVSDLLEQPASWLKLVSLVHPEEISLFARMPKKLHSGEAASLAIAQHRNWILLTDDRSARRYAKDHGIKLSGTLGCLVLGVENRLWSLEMGNGCLQRMINAGFYSPVTDLSELLKRPRATLE